MWRNMRRLKVLKSARMMRYLIIAACFGAFVDIVSGEFHHQSPEQYKLSLGWQEPGLWRPRWVMDRVFEDSEGKTTKTDRLYFKMKNDRTIKVYRQANRPFLELFKKGSDDGEEKKKKLFESGDESLASAEEQFKKKKVESTAAFYDVDGTWWWQDAAPLNGGKVKIETKEEVVPAEGKPEGIKEKIMHDVNIMWGNLDGYAAKFRKGKILKYRMTEAGVPLGTIPAGHFKVRVVTHRPLVSKDFMAYQ